MLKEQLVPMVTNGLPLLLVVAVLFAMGKYFARLRDAYWIVTAVVSIVAVIGAVALQAHRLSDEDPSNDLVDVTYVTYLIVPLFALALWINAKTTYQLFREQGELDSGIDVPTIHRLRDVRRRPRVDAGQAIDRVAAEVLDKQSPAVLIKQQLPALGLIGTVYGMSVSMGELGVAMSAAIGGDADGSEQMLRSLDTALGGMGGAFLTTLVGVSGSLLLTVLTSRTARQARRLVADGDDRLADEPPEDHGGESSGPSEPRPPRPTPPPGQRPKRRRAPKRETPNPEDDDVRLE